ncbi:hypothetical protein LCGC14_1145160 [marine sediment metagenome]|uniref:Uncharacterized protein n=1 Tax=marine sediment metagenome TaxID=412755 RepID=A0A0F9PF82_9ZZZZ
MIKEQKESLERLNSALRHIAKESGSVLVNHTSMVQSLEDSADYVFKGVLDCWSLYRVSGAEIAANQDDKQLQKLLKIRLYMAIYAMKNLLEDELELLQKVK